MAGSCGFDDIEVEDITAVFLRDMLGWVDVREDGAVGDGTTDDSAAFEAADAVADGRLVKVPAGQYFLGQNVTFENPVAFEGTVTMPDSAFLSLTRNFELPSYIAAFGDEVQAFRKAFQALLNNADHEGLDLGGRRINLRAPIDMQAAVARSSTWQSSTHQPSRPRMENPAPIAPPRRKTPASPYRPSPASMAYSGPELPRPTGQRMKLINFALRPSSSAPMSMPAVRPLGVPHSV